MILIKKIACKVLGWFVPQTKVLYKEGIHKMMDDFIESGCIVSEKAKLYSPYRICTNTKIGDYTYVSQNGRIQRTIVGKFCSIGPNLLCGWGIHPIDGVSTSPMFYSTMSQNGMTLSKTDKIVEQTPIIIGNDVFIGANVTILDGVTIGDGAVIGAGAVVNKDIPPYAIAVGCPIKILRYRFPEETINKLLKLKWWDMDESKLPLVEQYFYDVEKFIEECEKQ